MTGGTRPGANPTDHFGRNASAYREARPTYPVALFHYLAVACAARQQAWDCATGNGQAAVGLADRFSAVLATDASPPMIAQARTHPRVQYRVTTYDTRLADRSVDLVTVAQALHWLDMGPFLREARRVLTPQGVLAAWCYSNCRVTPPVDEVYDHFYTVILGPYWPAERRHVEDGYRSIALPIDEMAVPPLEIVEEWSVGEYLGYIRTWSGVHKCTANRGIGPLLDFEKRIQELWGDGGRRIVRWPLHFRVGQVR